MTLPMSEATVAAEQDHQPERSGPTADLNGIRRVLYLAAHGFELALVAVITFVSLIVMVPVEKVFQHLCESIATIALVHCVDTVRIIADRVATVRTYQWRATELGRIELAGLYHEFAEGADCERGKYMAYTVVTAILWLVVSVSYACYLSPISEGHSHNTMQSYLTDIDDEDHETAVSSVQKLPGRSKLPRVPAWFLDICVGAGAGAAFATAAWKVWKVSKSPEQVTLEFFMLQLGLCKKHEVTTADDCPKP